MFPQQSVKLKGRQNLMQIIESQQLNNFYLISILDEIKLEITID